ncbi:MAG: InlB B-repeat-containing protein, partial [Oscillospiraceae bacterium]|nr:InlB B-repeat-containing protein [Oscillospiraceae bacterium]
KPIILKAPDGYEISDSIDGPWGSDELEIESIDGKDQTQTYFLKNKDTGEITSNPMTSDKYHIDKTAPKGEIVIGENSFKKFINIISFGLFFKDSIEVIIYGSDGVSGVAKTEYYLSDTVMSEDDLSKFSGWTEGISTEKDAYWKGIVYAKITDKAGNFVIISSDGLIVYGDSDGILQGDDYVRGNGDDLTVEIGTGNEGNKVGTITAPDGTELIKDVDYVYDEVNNEIIFKDDYLKTLPEDDYEFTVIWNPGGEELSDNPPESKIVFKVTSFHDVMFDSNGGTAVAAINVEFGDTIEDKKPADPTKEGHDFNGWYKDSAFIELWDFMNDTVESMTTLYAKWTEIPVTTPPTTTSTSATTTSTSAATTKSATTTTSSATTTTTAAVTTSKSAGNVLQPEIIATTTSATATATPAKTTEVTTATAKATVTTKVTDAATTTPVKIVTVPTTATSAVKTTAVTTKATTAVVSKSTTEVVTTESKATLTTKPATTESVADTKATSADVSEVTTVAATTAASKASTSKQTAKATEKSEQVVEHNRENNATGVISATLPQTSEPEQQQQQQQSGTTTTTEPETSENIAVTTDEVPAIVTRPTTTATAAVTTESETTETEKAATSAKATTAVASITTAASKTTAAVSSPPNNSGLFASSAFESLGKVTEGSFIITNEDGSFHSVQITNLDGSVTVGTVLIQNADKSYTVLDENNKILGRFIIGEDGSLMWIPNGIFAKTCLLCTFCPNPLGVCVFIWGIAIAATGVIIAYAIKVRRKPGEEDEFDDEYDHEWHHYNSKTDFNEDDLVGATY